MTAPQNEEIMESRRLGFLESKRLINELDPSTRTQTDQPPADLAPYILDVTNRAGTNNSTISRAMLALIRERNEDPVSCLRNHLQYSEALDKEAEHYRAGAARDRQIANDVKIKKKDPEKAAEYRKLSEAGEWLADKKQRRAAEHRRIAKILEPAARAQPTGSSSNQGGSTRDGSAGASASGVSAPTGSAQGGLRSGASGRHGAVQKVNPAAVNHALNKLEGSNQKLQASTEKLRSLNRQLSDAGSGTAFESTTTEVRRAINQNQKISETIGQVNGQTRRYVDKVQQIDRVIKFN